MADSANTPTLVFSRRGRPRAPEVRTSLSTWLPASDADRLIQLARTREESVSQCLRRLITQVVRHGATF